MKCNSCGETWKNTSGGYVCPFCDSDNSMTPDEILAVYDKACADFEAKAYEMAAEGFLSAAERGHAEACTRYASCLERGLGVKKSTPEALVWLKNAARLGSGEGAGRLYRALSRVRFARDAASNLELWLLVAAELGDAESLEACGDLFCRTGGESFSPRRALYCYARAAILPGGESAARKLSRMLSLGELVPTDAEAAEAYATIAARRSVLSRLTRSASDGAPVISASPEKYTYDEYPADLCELALTAASAHEYEIAVLFYRRSAELGYIRAANCLGVCLERGRGAAADPEEAIRLYRIAAEAGSTLACLNLGDALRRGVGTEADEAAAFGWYLRAAELGNLHAQCLVADCYAEGRYTDADLRLALDWYKRAALGGHPRAMARADELGVEVTAAYNTAIAAEEAGDHARAFELYSLAAAAGHAGAICNLGILYQLGLGCERNARTAAALYRDAASLGSDAAAFNLGVCYLKGDGVCYSYREAKHYLRRALEAGKEGAEPLLAQAERNRKRKQIRRIYSLAATMQYKGNLKDAIRLRSIAGELGCARASYLLGCHLEFGCGIRSDLGRAAVYYDRAADLGYTSRTMKGAFLRFARSCEDRLSDK